MVSGKVILMKNLLLIIITLSFYFLNDAFARCNNDQRSFMEGLKLEQPSSLKVSFYDEKFEQANVNGYKGFASNGGNLGVGAVEYEEIYFDIVKDEKIDLCARVIYAQIFETRTVGFDIGSLNSSVGEVDFCEPKEYEKKLDDFNHICNWFEGDAELTSSSKKNKGTKGNASNSVVYRTGEILHKSGSELSCVQMATGFKSNYPGYYQVVMLAHFCISDFKYLTKEKIKSLAKSLGIYGIEDPPIGQRLSFHK